MMIMPPPAMMPSAMMPSAIIPPPIMMAPVPAVQPALPFMPAATAMEMHPTGQEHLIVDANSQISGLWRPPETTGRLSMSGQNDASNPNLIYLISPSGNGINVSAPPPPPPSGNGADGGNDGSRDGKGKPNNFYDDPTFYADYIGMRDGTHSANDHIERPSLQRLLPDVMGKRVLDLGCGTGGYTVEFFKDAAGVDAVDISERMLGQLRRVVEEKRLTNITVIRSAIEHFQFKHDYYDVVFSALAFHYIADLDAVFKNISATLKRGGTFLFSVEHPIYTATKNQGWETGPNGEQAHWRLDDYFERGARRVMWHGIEIERYHRTVQDYYDLLLSNDFRVERVVEPQASDEDRRLYPELVRHHRRPPHLIFLAYKK